ncbi:1318_t:CDS:2 [Acaulospora colombiana]|uniref:1318_t:CDS:1 n=1 Tax=Acaulospora colombiana TaxID=27376 RepID=A0ACA9KEF0_9GLOM|nr:1318_t:CDS:2 [Acaulospora colombiana]
MGKNFKSTKKGISGSHIRGKKLKSKKIWKNIGANNGSSRTKSKSRINELSIEYEDTDDFSAQDVFEIDQDGEFKEERRRKNIDELESYEYNGEEKIDVEDDEEIDSDEAFNKSDEERFDHFIFRGTNKKADKRQRLNRKIDLNEEDNYENSTDDESEDTENSSDNDINEERENDVIPDEGVKERRRVVRFDDEDNEATSLDENFFDLIDVGREMNVNIFGDESDEETMDLAEDDESVDEEREFNDDESKVEKLDSFIESLDKKRKRIDHTGSIEKRKRLIKERTEAYEESEYNLTTRESINSKKKIDFQDLLVTVQEETGFSGLKQKLASLESGGNKGNYKEPLSAPLPQRTLNKLNRQAAYDETKKDISKWEPIVKHNREAEHLVFPLNPNPQHQPTNNTLAGTFQPSTTLEKEVDSILIESGIKEKDLQQYEELQLNKLSVEEVAERRKELRRMRELMFREEIKAKRIAKIKSKTYRKIRKKEKEKNKLKLDELIELDPEAARKEKIRLETSRAQERMTLKHKNTSKWAKQALKHSNHDQESRQAIAEQLQRHEELKRKIHDLGSDEESYETSSDECIDQEVDINAIKDKAFGELAQLETKDSEVHPKGIMGMKFMRDAMERDRNKTKGLIDDFTEDLENLSNEDDSEKNDEKNEKDTKKYSVVHVGNNIGRMIFGIGSEKKSLNKNSEEQFNEQVSFEQEAKIRTLPKSTFDPKSDRENGQVTTSAESNNVSEQQIKSQGETNVLQKDNSDEENPWLQVDSSRVSTPSKKKNKGFDLKESNKSDKLVSKLKKLKEKSKKDDDVEIDMDKVLTINSTVKIIGRKKKKKEEGVLQSEKIHSDVIDESVGSDDEENPHVEEMENFVHSKSSMAFKQRELVARAFANDNVIDDFLAEKQAAIDEDKPKEEDITLPGWGTWVGKGVKQHKRKKVLVKPLPGEGVEVNKRQDAKLNHVIINEKRIKKAKKYLATDIPYPFQTREQYERSLRTPLGEEWNTREIFQKMIMPRVVTKMGGIIDPLNVPFQTSDVKD